jgi:hypothetical protein
MLANYSTKKVLLSTALAQQFPTIRLAHKKNTVARHVHKAGKQSKITQMELAARLQVLGIRMHRPGLSKLECGSRPATDVQVATTAEALKVSIAWLSEEETRY